MGLQVERQAAQRDARRRCRRQLRVREQHEPVRARLAAAANLERRAQPAIDQVAIREAQVGLVGRAARALHRLAQCRHCAGQVALDAHHRARREVAQLARKDAPSCAPRRVCGRGAREEVWLEAIVLDEKRVAALEPPVELHDRRAVANAVGRLNDEAAGHFGDVPQLSQPTPTEVRDVRFALARGRSFNPRERVRLRPKRGRKQVAFVAERPR
ncbi:MAG: hypothetical protein ACHQ6V_06390 [Myxococcota bacterium]